MLHAYDAAKAPTADQSFDVVSGRKDVATDYISICVTPLQSIARHAPQLWDVRADINHTTEEEFTLQRQE